MFLKFLKKIKPIHIILKKLKWLYLSLQNFSAAKKANKMIDADTYVHLMMNDKFIVPIVDFINSNFADKKNVFLCKRWFDYPFPNSSNTVEIKTFAGIKLKNAKKIICHSTHDEEIINRLYNEKSLLKKSFWVIWGSDLTKKRGKLTKKVKYVFSNFMGYCGEADEKFAREHLDIPEDLKFIPHCYPFPLNKKILDNTPVPKKNYIQIQLAQSIKLSAIPVMEWLSKFKDENIRVCSILSYGDSNEIKEKVKEAGIKYFGEKYFYIENYMSPEDYAKHVASNDVLILNDDYQDGFGNTLAHLYLGKKVFIRDDIQTPEMLAKHNVKVYPTQCIQNISFSELIKDESSESNKENIKFYLDVKELIKNWNKIFND